MSLLLLLFPIYKTLTHLEYRLLSWYQFADLWVSNLIQISWRDVINSYG